MNELTSDVKLYTRSIYYESPNNQPEKTDSFRKFFIVHFRPEMKNVDLY